MGSAAVPETLNVSEDDRESEPLIYILFPGTRAEAGLLGVARAPPILTVTPEAAAVVTLAFNVIDEPTATLMIV